MLLAVFYEQVLAWFMHQTMQQELVEHNHASYTETPKLFVLFQGYRHHNEKIIKVNSYCQHLTPLDIYNMHQSLFFFNYTTKIVNNESQHFQDTTNITFENEGFDGSKSWKQDSVSARHLSP